MGKIKFDVDAYTARLIGRENVSRLESAVAELVKIHMMPMQVVVFYIMKNQRTLCIWQIMVVE